MAATVYTPARKLANEGAHVTAIAWDVPCTRRRSARSCMPEAVFSYLIPPPKSQDAPRVFPRERPENDLQAAVEYVQGSHVIIDAMTGIGVSGALRGIAGASLPPWDSMANFPTGPPCRTTSLPPPCRSSWRSTRRPAFGVNDGSLPGPYIPADVTVTFGAMKPCAMVPPASYACGRLTLVDFGFDIDDCVPAAEMTDGDFVTDSIRLPQLRTASIRVEWSAW